MDDRKRESFFGSEGVPQPQRDQGTFSFGFLLLLVLASKYGNSVPFGGRSFLVLYQGFRFSYWTQIKPRDLDDVAYETFDFYHGATNSIVRKPGLRRVEGLQ